MIYFKGFYASRYDHPAMFLVNPIGPYLMPQIYVCATLRIPDTENSVNLTLFS